MIKRPSSAALLALFFLAFASCALAAPTATPRTMRLDYYHTGNVSQELFAVDRVVLEPLPWAGNLARAIDGTNLGKYFFEVRDAASDRVLYSRGFSSIYGEWETTDEARHANRTFSESLRFPAPAAPVKIVLKKRDRQNVFQPIWTTMVDPKDIFIDRSQSAPPGRLIPIQKTGDSAKKVDLLLLGDGYTAAEAAKFERDARRLVEVLFSVSPFKERRSDFNVWGLAPAAFESGVSRPSGGIYRDSPLGTAYDAFGTERYMLTFDNKAFRKVAQFAPYEFVEIITNTRTYGGGGIHNLYSTVAADSEWADYVFVHEFGHQFAGLADEYFTSQVAYLPPAERVEPWEPNATALLDPSNLKWKDLVTPGTPIPTPWDEAGYEKYSRDTQARRARLRAEKRPEDEMNRLFREDLARQSQIFGREKYRDAVGAFEGANYEVKGYYRPQLDCIMFSRSMRFCAVCRRAVSRVIDFYTHG